MRDSRDLGNSTNSSSSFCVILYGFSLYSVDICSAVGNHSCVIGTAAGEHNDRHLTVPALTVLGKTWCQRLNWFLGFMLFFFGLQGLTRTAHGAIALVGDNVRGISLAPPLEESVGLGGTSPNARDPASKNVDPGSLITELDWEETVA
jgi:hypothetical protein